MINVTFALTAARPIIRDNIEHGKDLTGLFKLMDAKGFVGMDKLGGDLLQRAERLLQEGKRQEARPLLIEFIHSHPDSARGWWVLSMAVADVRHQIDCMERVLKLAPQNAPARARLEKLKQSIAPQALDAPVGSSNAPKSERPIVPADADSQSARPVRKPRPASAKNDWLLLGAIVSVFCVCMVAGGLGMLAVFVPTQGQAAPEPTRGFLTMPPTWTPRFTPTSIPLEPRDPMETPPPTFTAVVLPPTVALPTRIGTSVGMTAPDFTLKNVDTGKRESLSAYRGKPVVILFWATWCTYCEREIPSLEQIYENYKNSGLIVLAVDVGESASKGRNYRASHNLTFSVLNDSGSDVARKYGVTGYPTNYFVDSGGRIFSVVVGMMQYVNLDINVKALMNLSN